MWWWIPLARKKFWWWIASSGLPYHNNAFQFSEYFVMRKCENIQRLFTSARSRPACHLAMKRGQHLDMTSTCPTSHLAIRLASQIRDQTSWSLLSN
jgi:hypothetical protein